MRKKLRKTEYCKKQSKPIHSRPLFVIVFIMLLTSCVLAGTKNDNSLLDPISILESQDENAFFTNEKIDNNAALKHTPTIDAQLFKQKIVNIKVLSADYINSLEQQSSKEESGTKQVPQNINNKSQDWRITSLHNQQKSKSSDDLQSIINQVKMIKIKPKQHEKPKEQQPETAKVDTQKTPDQIESPNEPVQPRLKDADSAASGSQLDPKLMEKISIHTANGSKVKNPLMLAELLNLTGNPKQAEYFYDLAITDSNNVEEINKNDKAWALYQKAHCQLTYDPKKSIETLQKLSDEYSSCPWAEAAKTKLQLQKWYRDEDLKNVMQQCKEELGQYKKNNKKTVEIITTYENKSLN